MFGALEDTSEPKTIHAQNYRKNRTDNGLYGRQSLKLGFNQPRLCLDALGYRNEGVIPAQSLSR